MYQGRQKTSWRDKFKNLKLGRSSNYEEKAPIYVFSDNDDSTESEEEIYLNENHSQFEPTPRQKKNSKTKKKWRKLPLNTTERVLNNISDDDRTDVVFPGGIFLRLASNSNKFPVELQLNVPFHSKDPIRIVLPPEGAVYDLELVPEPKRGGPRSEDWCQAYGVITGENLSGGILEDRGDTLLVWRVFRYDNKRLTPFGAYEKKNKNHHSQCQIMIYTRKEYDDLLKECCGVDARTITMRAIPLRMSDACKLQETESVPIHIHIYSPFVTPAKSEQPQDDDFDKNNQKLQLPQKMPDYEEESFNNNVTINLMDFDEKDLNSIYLASES